MPRNGSPYRQYKLDRNNKWHAPNGQFVKDREVKDHCKELQRAAWAYKADSDALEVKLLEYQLEMERLTVELADTKLLAKNKTMEANRLTTLLKQQEEDSKKKTHERPGLQ